MDNEKTYYEKQHEAFEADKELRQELINIFNYYNKYSARANEKNAMFDIEIINLNNNIVYNVDIKDKRKYKHVTSDIQHFGIALDDYLKYARSCDVFYIAMRYSDMYAFSKFTSKNYDVVIDDMTKIQTNNYFNKKRQSHDYIVCNDFHEIFNIPIN
jgi:hypothetical protein